MSVLGAGVVGPAEAARDATLLLLTADPGLSGLGVTFADVVAVPGVGGSYAVPARPGTDVLTLTWSPPRPDGDGTVRQRVCLSVVAPRTGSRAGAVLRAAERALLAADGTAPGTPAIAVAHPHVQRSLGDGLVTTGFDVLSAG